jgi:hypothetical protein
MHLRIDINMVNSYLRRPRILGLPIMVFQSSQSILTTEDLTMKWGDLQCWPHHPCSVWQIPPSQDPEQDSVL